MVKKDVVRKNLLGYSPILECMNHTYEKILLFCIWKKFYVHHSTVMANHREAGSLVVRLHVLLQESNFCLLLGSGEKSLVAPVGKSQFLTKEKNQNYPSHTSFFRVIQAVPLLERPLFF